MIPRLYAAWKVTPRYWAIIGEWRERWPFIGPDEQLSAMGHYRYSQMR